MPAFQSAADLSLSRKYHPKAVRCEICAKNASDLTTEQKWHELALQWHLMADQAAKMSGEAALDELESARWYVGGDASEPASRAGHARASCAAIHHRAATVQVVVLPVMIMQTPSRPTKLIGAVPHASKWIGFCLFILRSCTGFLM
jgi:hypothetical protein